ncbi:MAG: penicillin-binding protein [Alloprevotella sp.]|nr:penicillin-binding protein [Alloprevotella sp.]
MKNLLLTALDHLQKALTKTGRFLKRNGKAYIRHFKQGGWWKRTWMCLLTLFVFILLYVFAVSVNLFWLFGRSPSLQDIMHPKTPAASEIYSADGQLIGKFFNENRSPVNYDEVSPIFYEALISTEDERFYSHHGIDIPGLFSAAKDAAKGRARGASTITQQLVKNMFKMRSEYGTGLLGKIPGLHMLILKSKEMIIAVELELFNSKEDILRMYVNTVDFGSNAFGIKTAAKTYFNTTPDKLTAEQSAVLVGMLKATTAYNPALNPEASRGRRNVVLENMHAYGSLTRAQADSLKKLPLSLNFRVESVRDGQALYFRDAVADYLAEKCPKLNPYTDGLKIFTTLDMRMQKMAEEALVEQMRTVQRNFDSHWRGQDPWRDEQGRIIPDFIEKKLQRTSAYKNLQARFADSPDSVAFYLNKPHRVKLFTYDGIQERDMSTTDSLRYMAALMHAGFVAMEPNSGEIKAWVGDIDYKTWQYDKVTASRQPGSTFKLFVYAAAMEQGMTPSDRRRDSYVQMEVFDKSKNENVIWRPTNANGFFSGADLPLRSAFAQSINSVAVKVGQEVGIDNIVKLAQKMGVTSHLDPTPSLALGSSDMQLEELVGAYSTIANDGEYVEPVLVTRIEDANGKVIYEAKPEKHRAISKRSAFYMQKMLEAGIRDAGGTSQSMQHYLGNLYWSKKIDAGGKTGTSNNHSDAWYVCVTPQLVAGAWVGAEDRCVHFRTGALGQGSKTALPIVGLFYQKALADPKLQAKYAKVYPEPSEPIRPELYNSTYYIPTTKSDSDSLTEDNSLLVSSADNLMEGDKTTDLQQSENHTEDNLFD